MKYTEDNDDSGIDLNMTPMVDIVFLLIIFFLTTTSIIQLEQDLTIDLPKQSEQLKAKAPPARPVIVNVRYVSGGKAYYHVENEPMSLAALTSNLSRAKIRNKNQAVVIRGDRNVKWEHIAAVMGCCGKVGITKVSATVEITQS
ncbi:MAG: biopolymer transporter ExbD [Planctomycetota bacterium]|nr:biopolymer transporter ExbD [Planctomycetota bacterium]